MVYYFIAFASGCGLLLGAVAIRPKLIYQYPFFMGATFTAFILPQATALLHSNWQNAFGETTLLMCTLCLTACWVGYALPARPLLMDRLTFAVNTNRFLQGGIALVLIGYYFTNKFRSLSEDDVST